MHRLMNDIELVVTNSSIGNINVVSDFVFDLKTFEPVVVYQVHGLYRAQMYVRLMGALSVPLTRRTPNTLN